MSLEVIKKIRSLTGAGIVDVQKALAEANNDEEKAIQILREQGQKMAAKREDRTTHEGVIAIAKGAHAVAMASLTCETDFVALNADFIQAAQDFADLALTTDPAALKAQAEDKIKNELILKIGENIQFGESKKIEGSIIGSYLHSNKKIASAVSLHNGSQEVANDLALHIAAFRPDYLKPEDVPAELIATEQAIYRKQLEAENKPAEMIEKILPGKLEKYYAEVCFLKQKFVKDDSMSVEQYLQQNNASVDTFIFIKI
jgi:elongation factor Ts